MKTTLRNASLTQIADFLADYPCDTARLCGFADLRPLHNDWMHKMIMPGPDMTLQAHRGSYKTSCLSFAIAVIMILFPRKNILFMRKTGGDVVEVVRQVAKLLRSEPLTILYERLYGFELEFAAESGTSITLGNYDTTRGAAQLLGVGTVGSLTGKHGDLIITDDIVNLQDRVSKAERDRIKGIYQELQNIRNRGGRIINTGTPWHKDDAFTLMPNIERYDYKATGLLTSGQIDNLKKSMAPSLFAANYELRHIASDDALFQDSPAFFLEDEKLYDGIMHVDAAYDGEDSTAITIAKREGQTIYAYGWKERKHVDRCMPKIVELFNKYRIGYVFCELNGDKGYLAKELEHAGVRCKTYHEAMNKYLKISTFLRKWWANMTWHESTSPEYLAEIMDYTEDSEHDDAPDSAACVCRRLNRDEWEGI